MRNARNYVRERRGPDSYFRYKRKREDEREVAESGDEREREYAEHDRVEAERSRDYEERYMADRERETTENRAEQAEGNEPDA